MSKIVYEQQYSVTYTHDLFSKGLLSECWRNAQGQLERPGDLPTIISYSDTGEETHRAWYVKGQLHRENGPAWQFIQRSTGTVVSEVWYRFGKEHRDGDLPARIYRSHDTGRIVHEEYMKNGMTHRETGPAIINYHPDTGRPYRWEYWYNDRKIPKKDWKALIPTP